MSDLDYSISTWRVQVVKGIYVEINVKGCKSDAELASLEDLERADVVLGQLARAVKRVRRRHAEALLMPKAS
jgi:predicted TIM-barrel fold metal-dependent hydrolase